MKNSRDVFLTIGKKTYRISTPLEDEVVDRLKVFIDEACGTEFKNTEQEDLLMLTCLRLAYYIDIISSKVEDIAAKIENDT